MKHALLSICVTLSLGTFGFAAEISLFIPESLPSGGEVSISDYPNITFSGEIEESDVGEMKKLIKEYFDTAPAKILTEVYGPFVRIESNGGDLYAAMEIGRMLRANNLSIMPLRAESECSSACIFLFAGGAQRMVTFDMKFGLHRPSLPSSYFAGLSAKEAKGVYDKMIADGREYLKEMGISGELMDDMLKVASNDANYQGYEYAERVNLEGKDPGYDEWTLARRIEKYGKPSVDAMQRKLVCLNNGYEESVCEERRKLGLARDMSKCTSTAEEEGVDCLELFGADTFLYLSDLMFECTDDVSKCYEQRQKTFADLSRIEASYRR